MSSKNYFL